MLHCVGLKFEKEKKRRKQREKGEKEGEETVRLKTVKIWEIARTG